MSHTQHTHIYTDVCMLQAVCLSLHHTLSTQSFKGGNRLICCTSRIELRRPGEEGSHFLLFGVSEGVVNHLLHSSRGDLDKRWGEDVNRRTALSTCPLRLGELWETGRLLNPPACGWFWAPSLPQSHTHQHTVCKGRIAIDESPGFPSFEQTWNPGIFIVM